ncbi:MAG: TonB-dependent receptor [Flavobacteriales bacterium]
MFFRTISIVLLLLLASSAWAQGPVTGHVRATTASGTEPLPGASVLWVGTSIGTSTDEEGRFSVGAPPQWPARLVVFSFGFANDTLHLVSQPTAPLSITLRAAAIELPGTDVIERQSGTLLSTRTLQATESLGRKELKRAACCDLSESFETNATIDVNFADAISGAKTIRMLGLDGKYAQISMENIPFVRGLSSTSGLSLIPGTWIKDINLSKGIGTAVNGPNAMTGQIDLCLLNPGDEGPLFVNLYGNTQGRTEANIHTAQRTGAHSNNLLMVHGNWFNTDMDQNNDGFMDQPQSQRVNVMDRWLYQGERKSGQVALRYVTESRKGGESSHMNMSGEEHHHHDPYTIDVQNEMVDLFAKHGFIFKNDPTKSLGFIVSARDHAVDSRYGLRTYTGQQQSFYANVIYQQLLGKGTDQIKTGLSFQYDDYREAFRDSAFARTERMPGVFAEYTYHRKDVAVVAGLRADANDLYGTAVSPRLHAKFDLGPLTTARVSAGYAFRTANPLVESGAVMASSRTVVVEGTLGMERSWNIGASFLHKFKWLDHKWAFGVDAYRTIFETQVVTDLDRSPQTVAFYMLEGPSYANSLLTDLQVDLSRTLQLKGSYRFYDVRTTYDGRLLERPFTPSHRGLIDLAYADIKAHWRFDITLNLFGQGRIPSTATNPEAYRMMERSPGYGTLHAQLTRILGAWEVYIGAENITSTIQEYQIIQPEDPYGPYFDASMIWGPTNKAMVYGGLRFNIERKGEPTPL